MDEQETVFSRWAKERGIMESAYGYAGIVDGKIIFIDRRPSSVSIQVNKRNDAMIAAVFVVLYPASF